METTTLIHQKKKKLSEVQGVDGNSKCLVNLSEEIFRHILSFLPTKDAVKTSVLSKKWQYLWASIPNLDFQLLSPTKRELWMNFVERVLCLRDYYDIKRFSLHCHVLHDASRVNTWISAAVRHNVEDLYIQLDKFEGVFSLPLCLFTCETLISLYLDMPYILKLPSTICFSNLKILTIVNVTFSDEYLTQQFFSGLPVLVGLCLNNCSWEGLKVVSISAPKLHSLRIREGKGQHSSDGDGCQVMIVGSNVKKFHYWGRLFSNYCFNSFSLEEAHITMYAHNTSEQSALRMHKLLSGLSNVKFLGLSSQVLKVLKYAAELPSPMPIFSNLLELMFIDRMPVDLDCVTLLQILQRSPFLEILRIFGGISMASNCEEHDRILDPVPPCFLSHLKWIKVENYDGDEKELCAVKILLKNAIVLDKIDISFSKHIAGDLEKQVKVCKHLIALPRGSQNCKIILK